ncbi:MAG: DUF366 family protein [Bdellovibrio sp.]|nr:DUF366 family protein [Bdellovibrio sp.]
MKKKFISKKINYDGGQLKPLYAYVNHKLHGDSIVAFIGACDVGFGEMVDAEDLVAGAQIKSDLMLHFIIEMFNQNLMTAVSLQRLIVSIAQNILNSTAPQLKSAKLRRSGDDLYLDRGSKAFKLSISIASISPVSSMIHFALNITNDGTPVPTCSLKDLGVDPKSFAEKVLTAFSEEYISIVEATQKVRPLV